MRPIAPLGVVNDCERIAGTRTRCVQSVTVKLMVQVKLLPTPVQAAALEATLRACNEAATWTSEVAFGLVRMPELRNR